MSRFFWIAATMVCAASASHAQVILPNDGRADEVIREKCESDWPTDFNMRVACIRIQREALKQLSGNPSNRRPPEPQVLIEKTDPGGVPLFQQGPFKPTAIHDGYNRPLRRDRQDY